MSAADRMRKQRHDIDQCDDSCTSQWQFTYQDGVTTWPVDCICRCHVPLYSNRDDVLRTLGVTDE